MKKIVLLLLLLIISSCSSQKYDRYYVITYKIEFIDGKKESLSVKQYSKITYPIEDGCVSLGNYYSKKQRCFVKTIDVVDIVYIEQKID